MMGLLYRGAAAKARGLGANRRLRGAAACIAVMMAFTAGCASSAAADTPDASASGTQVSASAAEVTAVSAICNNQRLSDEDAVRQIASFLLFVEKPDYTSAQTLDFSDAVCILRTMLVHTDAIIDSRVHCDGQVVSVAGAVADEYMQDLFGCDMPEATDDYILGDADDTDTEAGWRDGTFYFGQGWWNVGKFNYDDGENEELTFNGDGTVDADIVFHPRDFLDTHVRMVLVPVDTDFRYQVVTFQTESVENGDLDFACEAEEATPQPTEAVPDERYEKALAAHDRKDYDTAFPLFKELAEEGDASAQFYLGMCYEYAQGVTQNYYTAFDWYLCSAEQGNSYGEYGVGLCYRLGRGVLSDYTQMIYWLSLSAEQGNAYGLLNLGYCYHKGIGVDQDLEEARRLYELADEAGHPAAKQRLEEVEALLCG